MKALSLIAVAFLAGCSTAPLQTSPTEPAPRATAKPAVTQASPAPAVAPATQETESQRLSRLIAELKDKSVFFAYDDFSVEARFVDLIKQHAEATKKIGSGNLVVEGNADDRGSTEYNLALGNKRAEAVRRALVQFGAPEARIEAVSFGEEKPRQDCKEERCWGQNRRVDFNYQAK